MHPTHVPSRSRMQILRLVPSPMMPDLLQVSDAASDVGKSVLVVMQLKLMVSISVFVNMCAVMQHLYSVSGINPSISIVVMFALTLPTSTERVCPLLILVQDMS